MKIIERKKKQSELKRTNDTSNSTTFFANTGTSNPICSHAKTAKTVSHQIPHVKNCITCNQNKCRGDS